MTATEMTTDVQLLTPEVVRALQGLNLGSRVRRAGKLRGDRRSTKRGSSVEFADYRTYSPGDDLRRVDWNLYARTDKLFLKLYEEEEDRAVHLLVDSTASMRFGTPSKYQMAVRLAAALGYVALHEMDRLQVARLIETGPELLRPLRGTGAAPLMLDFLGVPPTTGQGALDRALSEYARRSGMGGILIILSDLLEPRGIRGGLRALGARGHEIVVLHVLSREELEPTLVGDLELVDVESRDRQPITLDQAALEAYERRLDAWLTELRRECSAVGASYNLVTAETPLEDVLFGQLRKAGVLGS